jgi:hypothetical protein
MLMDARFPRPAMLSRTVAPTVYVEDIWGYSADFRKRRIITLEMRSER